MIVHKPQISLNVAPWQLLVRIVQCKQNCNECYVIVLYFERLLVAGASNTTFITLYVCLESVQVFADHQLHPLFVHVTRRYGLIIPNKKAVNKPVKKLAVFGNDSSDDEVMLLQ